MSRFIATSPTRFRSLCERVWILRQCGITDRRTLATILSVDVKLIQKAGKGERPHFKKDVRLKDDYVSFPFHISDPEYIGGIRLYCNHCHGRLCRLPCNHCELKHIGPWSVRVVVRDAKPDQDYNGAIHTLTMGPRRHGKDGAK